MDRFHIVVQNYNKIQSFVDNFSRIETFDPSRDRVYFFDCSSDDRWESELVTADLLTKYDLEWNHNLFFVRRRNWGVNHGAQLDYFRCLLDRRINIPSYAAFVQEHYFDLKNNVKEDTIPEDARYSLDDIQKEFESDSDIGCVFLARNGIRVCVSHPAEKSMNDFFGDASKLLENAIPRCFCTDGGNFIVRPQLFLNWFIRNRKYLTKGNGSYGFAHVWETRLGKILYDQNIKWSDMYRGVRYRTIDDLLCVEDTHKEKLSAYWYDNWLWYFFHGRDQQRYRLVQLRPVLRYLMRDWLPNALLCSRNKRLEFVTPTAYVRGNR